MAGLWGWRRWTVNHSTLLVVILPRQPAIPSSADRRRLTVAEARIAGPVRDVRNTREHHRRAAVVAHACRVTVAEVIRLS